MNDGSFHKGDAMSVRIRPMGQLKSSLNNQSEITVDAGRTVRETLVMLQIKPEIVAGVVVNGDLQSMDYVLLENDDVKLFSIMGGG
jgi:sulfur carrier protein ThiS